jgi:hypothetical protein
VESLPLLQPAWQETAAQNGSKKPRPLRTTASWVGSSWNPLNTKVVARDGPSHAAARLAPDRVAALPCSLGRRNLAAESNLSSPEPYSWRAGSCRKLHTSLSLRGAQPPDRWPGRVWSYMSSACCYANANVSRLSLFWSGIVIAPAWPWCREIVIVHLRLIVANKDG